MEQFWVIFWGCVGTLLTALFSWLGVYITGLLNSKIKDQKLRTFLTKFSELLIGCVNSLTQTVVEPLKKEGKFTDEVAQKVKKDCVSLIKTQLSQEMINFITENYGDLTDFISTQIESFLLQNKVHF